MVLTNSTISICVHRLDEWANVCFPLCRGGRDQPYPLWAGVHRGHQPAHADPWDPEGGPGEPDRVSASTAHSLNSYAGAREDCCSRWVRQIVIQYNCFCMIARVCWQPIAIKSTEVIRVYSAQSARLLFWKYILLFTNPHQEMSGILNSHVPEIWIWFSLSLHWIFWIWRHHPISSP